MIRKEDSRRARLEALDRPGRALKEHEMVDDIDDVPPIVTRLHKVWSTAITRVKQDHPGRTFTCSRERVAQRGGGVQVTITITRTA